MPTSSAYVVTASTSHVGLDVADDADEPMDVVDEALGVADGADLKAVVAGRQRRQLGVVDVVGVAAHGDGLADGAPGGEVGDRERQRQPTHVGQPTHDE